jgi:hypothetical protein
MVDGAQRAALAIDDPDVLEERSGFSALPRSLRPDCGGHRRPEEGHRGDECPARDGSHGRPPWIVGLRRPVVPLNAWHGARSPRATVWVESVHPGSCAERRRRPAGRGRRLSTPGMEFCQQSGQPDKVARSRDSGTGLLRWTDSGPCGVGVRCCGASPWVSHSIERIQCFQYVAVCGTMHQQCETPLIFLLFVRTLNQRVEGSSPSTPTNKSRPCSFHGIALLGA